MLAMRESPAWLRWRGRSRDLDSVAACYAFTTCRHPRPVAHPFRREAFSRSPTTHGRHPPPVMLDSRSKIGETVLRCAVSILSLLLSTLLLPRAHAQSPTPPTPASPEKIIIDTDIGDDIDDAFAVALALRSPELQILGITTTFGDTEARARIVDRMLGEIARRDIPVLAGIPTQTKNPMSQRRYGDAGRFTRASHPPAVDFILDQIRR